MKKEITFLELLQKVKEGTAPEVVWYKGDKYMNRPYGYVGGEDYLIDIICCSKSIYDLAREKCISYEETPLLTFKEREYLSAVLKPFKNRVEYVRKCCGVTDGCYYIQIEMNNEAFSLPEFGKYTGMYSGMKVNQAYTLSELGLWEEE